MPFVPNVHIVGDESDEADEVNPEVQPTISSIPPNPNGNGRPVEESETSESTEDDETDENEKESDSSSDDGADWSMDVTHIARTPERYSSTVPQEEKAETIDNVTSMSIDMDASPSAPKKNGNKSADRKQQKNKTLTSDLQSSPINFKVNKPIEEKDEKYKKKEKNAVLNLSKNVEREYESPKGDLATDLQISSSNSESDVTVDEKDDVEIKKLSLPGLSLPSPTANQSQFKALPFSRLRLPSITADYSTPPTIGGRVAKRARRGVTPTQPIQNFDLEHMLAKPLDVTMYFQELSAKLVKSRVKLMPFLGLRQHIDSLVDQAMGHNY